VQVILKQQQQRDWIFTVNMFAGRFDFENMLCHPKGLARTGTVQTFRAGILGAMYRYAWRAGHGSDIERLVHCVFSIV
jgi:hypothetical protein